MGCSDSVPLPIAPTIDINKVPEKDLRKIPGLQKQTTHLILTMRPFYTWSEIDSLPHDQVEIVTAHCYINNIR